MSYPLLDLRRSTAELLAWAVTELFPSVTLAGGECTDHGFYYDFVTNQRIDELALPLIEEKMRDLVKRDLPIRSLDMMRENAADLFIHKNQPLIADLVSECLDNIVQVFHAGEFYDFCPGCIVSSTGQMSFFKVISISKDGNQIRIHGTAFPNAMALKRGLKAADTAKKRDHRTLGPEMDLFSLKDGDWFWHPKGVKLREIIHDWWRDELRQLGYQLIKTPLINHLGDFRTGFIPAHTKFYQANLHSYRELPIRYAEWGELYSPTKEGTQWGLLKSPFFTGEAAYNFFSPSEAPKEIISSLQFIDKIIKILGFEYYWYLGLRGQKFAGTLSNWDEGTEWIRKAFETSGFSYANDPHAESFEGPYAEARLIDALGREWKGPRIGIDFNCPERFGLHYQGADDEMHAPVMLVQTVFSSFDRFIAILMEHCDGIFPLWMAPEQVRIMAVSKKNLPYADEIRKALENAAIRVNIDLRGDQLGSKIHAAERERIPYMIVIGDREESKKVMSVRTCKQKELRKEVKLEDFIKELQMCLQDKLGGSKST